MIIKTGARAAEGKPSPPVVVNKDFVPPTKPERPKPVDLTGSVLEVYHDIEQGTDEWHEVRRGVLTASSVGKLLTSTGKLSAGETAKSLMRSLVAERLTGRSEHFHISADMERGNFDEPLARDLYSETYAPVTEVGFMVRDFDGLRLGYSPDGLVGDDGLIEVKSRRQSIQLKTVLEDQVPAENMAQLQAGLLVSGREWIDYLSYSGGMPMYRIRVTPDPVWQATILEALTAFEKQATEWADTYLTRTEGLPATEYVDWFGEMEMQL